MPNGYIVYNTPTAFSVKNGRSQKKKLNREKKSEMKWSKQKPGLFVQLKPLWIPFLRYE